MPMNGPTKEPQNMLTDVPLVSYDIAVSVEYTPGHLIVPIVDRDVVAERPPLRSPASSRRQSSFEVGLGFSAPGRARSAGFL